VRYRIDGELQQANIPGEVRRFQAAIVSRLNPLAPGYRRKAVAQDGRIKLKISGREIDVRVSIIPMLHGEAVVLRILDRSDALLGTQYLGMAERDRKAFDTILELPHGIVLVTGPTGSAKPPRFTPPCPRSTTSNAKSSPLKTPSNISSAESTRSRSQQIRPYVRAWSALHSPP